MEGHDGVGPVGVVEAGTVAGVGGAQLEHAGAPGLDIDPHGLVALAQHRRAEHLVLAGPDREDHRAATRPGALVAVDSNPRRQPLDRRGRLEPDAADRVRSQAVQEAAVADQKRRLDHRHVAFQLPEVLRSRCKTGVSARERSGTGRENAIRSSGRQRPPLIPWTMKVFPGWRCRIRQSSTSTSSMRPVAVWPSLAKETSHSTAGSSKKRRMLHRTVSPPPGSVQQSSCRSSPAAQTGPDRVNVQWPVTGSHGTPR